VLHQWFSRNGLVNNPDKSEAVLFSTAQRARTSPLALDEVDVADSPVNLANSVGVLGVLLDKRLTLDNHVQNICRSANYRVRALRHIRSSLLMDTARMVACALVNSRLDYANSILCDVTDYQHYEAAWST
jgi:hypothetical protein